jgi:hypothetical protein
MADAQQGFARAVVLQALCGRTTQPSCGSQAAQRPQGGEGPDTQAPAAHASPTVQALPSSQGTLLFGWAHWPVPLQTSSVHALASAVHAVPAAAAQASAASLQVRLHSGPLAHGSPACRAQVPPLHVSAPLQ